MAQSTVEKIREKMLAGQTIEAGTLLTADGSDLGADERAQLGRELDRLHREVERLVAQGEAFEQKGQIDPARHAYASAQRLSVDHPGIGERIKRVDEALLLSRAIRRRGQRLRRPAPEPTAEGRTSRPLLFVAGLSVGLAFLAGAIALMRDQPSTGIIIQQPQVVKREAIIPAPPPSEPKAPEPAPPPVVPAPVETIATASALPDPAPQQVATSKPPPPAPVRAKPLLATTAKKGPDRPKHLYTVRAGDTLSAIAERELCNQALWQAIHRLNRDRIDDPARLRPGLQLNLKGLDSECGRKR